ncbi:hypothetical protein U8335_03835 [Roseiconus lacunae]|uniref:hypothetical protein n=1 Tax=Roseiconus lacunae TaxID=2605694 RepID=UPI003092B47A|nr:hypothetical protein U8335_03835 [Stieleria sp. HD01]
MRRPVSPVKTLVLICGGLFFLSAACSGLYQGFFGVEEETAADDQSEAIAVVPNVADDENYIEELVDSFVSHVSKSNSLATLVAHATFENDVLKVTVANSFHSLPYQVRLQHSQEIAIAWEARFAPSEDKTSRVAIVDQNGNKVGGFDALWGAWVDK